MGSALFWDITQNMLLIPYRYFGPIFNGQEIQEEMSVIITNICCVISQNSAYLIYFAAEAWNHALLPMVSKQVL
jgi:hypothetical protein